MISIRDSANTDLCRVVVVGVLIVVVLLGCSGLGLRCLKPSLNAETSWKKENY